MKRTQKLIRKLAKLYGVRVYFYTEGYIDASGIYMPRTKTIRIMNDTREEMLSTFFHELGHKHCHDKGLWDSYHNRKFKRGRAEYTTDQLRKIVKTAVRAERWVDKFGREHMGYFFPELEYSPGYGTEADVNWYKKNYLNWFKFQLRWRTE